MKKLQMLLSSILLVGMLLAACAPATSGPGAVITPTPAQGPSGTSAPAQTPTGSEAQGAGIPAVAKAVLPELASKLNLPADQIKFKSAEAVQWPDSCLGVQVPGIMCAMMVTPGYRILFDVKGEMVEVHTNQSGDHFVIASGITKGGLPNPNQPPAALAAQKYLAQQLGVPETQVKIAQIEAVDWPDGCLGVQMPGRLCASVITPGYRVLLEANGKQYEFHTDKAGGAIYSAVAPLPETADKVVVWQQTENSVCSRAEIGAKGVAYGPCGSALKETALETNRAEELAYLYGTYGTFNSSTKAGTIQFNGQGQQQAGEAEMRSIAEWAKLVFMEAQSGRTGAAWGLAFSWHREGGIAGFCDDLGVYLDGWAVATSCKGNQPKSFREYRLKPDELAQVYQWVDQYKAFDYQQSDGAVADSMKVSLNFVGAGTMQAAADQQQQLAQLASTIYSEAAR